MQLLPTYCLHSHYRVRTQLIRQEDMPYVQIHTSDQAADYLRNEIGDYDREILFLIGLNSGNVVNVTSTIHVGSVRECVVSAMDIYKVALLGNCTAVIIGHNHPGGDPHPSREDKLVTDKVMKAGNVLDIKLLDHVIITDDNYFSFADEGLL